MKLPHIIRLPFLGRIAIVPDQGTADFFPGGLTWSTHLSATHIRGGEVLQYYDLGSGRVTTDAVQDLAQDWTNTVTPVGAKAAPTFGANAGTGGFMSNGTYNYRVTALMPTGESIGTSGSVVLAGGTATQTQVVNWVSTSGAIGYKVYRTIAAGAGGTEKWVGTVTSGATLTFTDTVSDVTQATGYAVPTLDTTNWATLRAANYHDTGTDSTADAASDFKLNAAVTTIARLAGTQSNPSNGQYRSSATIVYVATNGITEWGLFNHARAVGDTAISGLRPSLWDRRSFGVINVQSGDSITYQYTLTINSGG